MVSQRRTESLAVLLTMLGDEASELALKNISGPMANELKELIDDFKTNPPTVDEAENVIDDFKSYFRFAKNKLKKEMEAKKKKTKRGPTQETPMPEEPEEDEKMIVPLPEEHFNVDLEPTRKFIKPRLTGNTVHDLNRAHPYQVAFAVQKEQPAIISHVIRNLATAHAAKTLEYLPDDLRSNVFLHLAMPTQVSKLVVDEILDRSLEQALEVDQREEVEDTSEKMAELMRSLPREVRGPMMDELIKSDENLGNQVKSMLYRFDDLNKLEDRDLQQVLSKCRTEDFVVGLQQANPELVGRIFKNMSKRAAETLKEEMEFKTNCKPEEIEEARSYIVKRMIELDEAGAISLG